MDIHWSQLISGAIGFLTATVAGVIGYFGIARQSGNQETEIVLTAWKELLAPIQKELTDLEEDLGKLYDEKTKSKIENRSEKLSATPSDDETNKRAKRDRGGQELGQGLEKFDESLKSYTDAIATLKGINQGFLDSNSGT